MNLFLSFKATKIFLIQLIPLLKKLFYFDANLYSSLQGI